MALPFINFSLSGKPGFWFSGNLEYWVSGIMGFPGIRDSGLIGFLGIQIPKQGYQQPLLSASHEE